MQLFVDIPLHTPLTLPLSYHHILQGIIYSHVSGSQPLDDSLHDHGASYGKRSYKHFCFSTLHGDNYLIHDERITFYDEVWFELRSVKRELICEAFDSLTKNGIRFGNQVYTVKARIDSRTIDTNQICVNMLSPLTVYSTDPNSGKIHYFNPLDPEFARLVSDNFYRKYAAYSGSTPKHPVEIVTLSVGSRDKYITRYKKSLIIGWNGAYQLSGDPEYLSFLYNTGIGSKSSQGFGLFEIAEEDDDDENLIFFTADELLNSNQNL